MLSIKNDKINKGISNLREIVKKRTNLGGGKVKVKINLANLKDNIHKLGNKAASVFKDHLPYLISKSTSHAGSLSQKTLNLIKNINPRSRRFQFGMAGALLALVALGIFAFSIVNRAYAVQVNGKTISIVKDEEAARKAVKDVLALKSKELDQKVITRDKIVFQKVKAKQKDLDTIFTLKNKLADTVNFRTQAAVIKVNDKEHIALLNKNTAEKVLNDVKASYLQNDGKIQIESVGIAEEVKLITKETDIKKIAAPDKAVEILKNGSTKVVKHTIKEGESLWWIARKNDMRVKEILAANPGLNESKIQPGQEINLTKVEPIVNVIVTARKTVEENIPYPVKVEKDSSLYRGNEKVKQQGVPGKKEVTYQLVMKNGQTVEKKVMVEKVLAEAKPKIVVRGTRVLVASRGSGTIQGGGSGALGWPVSGRINSGFGRRGRGYHTGIDIGAPYGAPIGAAESGRVVFTGWDGAYGKRIIIDHGNGLQTAYGHCSAFNVSPGDNVSRGQIIGFVGSTGRATGAHVHFEVIVNGSYQNPLNYLR